MAMLLLTKAGAKEPSGAGFVQATGEVAMRPCAQGRYTVWVVPQGDLSYYRADFKVTAEPIEITLERGETIRGRLEFPGELVKPEGVRMGMDGQPEGSASVGTQERGVFTQVRPDADGHFVLRGLPPGTWTLHGSAHTSEGHATGTLKARTGSDVVLRLAPKAK